MAAARHDRPAPASGVAPHRVRSRGRVDVAWEGVLTGEACMGVADVASVRPAIVRVVGRFVGILVGDVLGGRGGLRWRRKKLGLAKLGGKRLRISSLGETPTAAAAATSAARSAESASPPDRARRRLRMVGVACRGCRRGKALAERRVGR